MARARYVRLLAAMVLLAVAAAGAGCVTKAKADARARAAYMAGRRDAFSQLQEQARGPSVLFFGPLNRRVVTWHAGLTLAQAMVRAEYYAPNDPSRITIRRDGQEIPVDPTRLLEGEDVPVEAGDLVEVQP